MTKTELDAMLAESKRLDGLATDGPWFRGDVFKDEDDQTWQSIGPFDMSEKEIKQPYEDTIADFWGDNHNCEANSEFVCFSRTALPALVAEVERLRRVVDQAVVIIKADISAASNPSARRVMIEHLHPDLYAELKAREEGA